MCTKFTLPQRPVLKKNNSRVQIFVFIFSFWCWDSSESNPFRFKLPHWFRSKIIPGLVVNKNGYFFSWDPKDRVVGQFPNHLYKWLINGGYAQNHHVSKSWNLNSRSFAYINSPSNPRNLQQDLMNGPLNLSI